ncbi:PREDICTED: uncharacterized protein LOC108552673 [Eufriesea mexicana]|uniref:uncharacterized protein LOC108552673 n=1 Tax=Eufriesea mexicana TaxID=516756 RepID=UPI00083C0443|nr:PREDICTED: uncharacterized protein LOC108552673 [Eufriesea mexicana]
MEIFSHHCFLVAFLALLGEIIEMADGYKRIRPYKYYQPRPWRRPRWYADHKSSKFYHSKRISPEDYYSRRPSNNRYDSARDEFDGRVENQPYTILIQLPKREDKYGDDNYVHKKRKYEKISIPLYDNENDYIYDESDTDSKVVNLNDKKVYIKMVKGEHPKLQIQISRSDNEGNIKGTKILPILPKIHENFTPSVQSETRAFTPHENF